MLRGCTLAVGDQVQQMEDGRVGDCGEVVFVLRVWWKGTDVCIVLGVPA